MKLVRDLRLSADNFLDLSYLLDDVSGMADTSPTVAPNSSQLTVKLSAESVKEANGNFGAEATFNRELNPISGIESTRSAQIQMQHPIYNTISLSYSANNGGFWTADISGNRRTITTQDASNLIVPNLVDPQDLEPLLDRPVDHDPEDFLYRLYVSMGSQAIISTKDTTYELPNLVSSSRPNAGKDQSTKIWRSLNERGEDSHGITVEGLYSTDYGDIVESIGYSALVGSSIGAGDSGGTVILRSRNVSSRELYELIEAEAKNHDRHFIALLESMKAFREYIKRSDRSILEQCA